MSEVAICTVCNQEKPITEFNWRDKAKGRRHRSCKSCHSAYRRSHYLDNRQKYIEKAKRINRKYRETTGREIQRFVYEYLRKHPCVDCGETNPIVLDFDHVRGKKRESIAVLMHNRASMATIKAEIAKCEIRCANCHRIRTATMGGWWITEFVNNDVEET